MKNKFAQTTHVEKMSNHRHKVAINDLWSVHDIPNGGYLMATAAKAMVEHSSHPHPLSVTAYYLEKTDMGDAIVHSELLKAAKSVSTLSGRLLQKSHTGDQEPILRERIRLTAAFTNFDYVKGQNHSEKEAPMIAPFEKCKEVKEVAPHLQMYDQFNFRFDPLMTGFIDNNPNELSELNLWLEYADQSAFDVFSLLMVPDMMPPAIFNRVGASGWVPTIEMTVHVRAIPQTSRLQIRVRTNYLTNGILEEDVEVWDEQGKLLAISRQIAKLRMPK